MPKITHKNWSCQHAAYAGDPRADFRLPYLLCTANIEANTDQRISNHYSAKANLKRWLILRCPKHQR